MVHFPRVMTGAWDLHRAAGLSDLELPRRLGNLRLDRGSARTASASESEVLGRSSAPTTGSGTVLGEREKAASRVDEVAGALQRGVSVHQLDSAKSTRIGLLAIAR